MATIKCPNCGVYNTNRDYCEECKTVLSYKIRRELAFKKQEEFFRNILSKLEGAA